MTTLAMSWPCICLSHSCRTPVAELSSSVQLEDQLVPTGWHFPGQSTISKSRVGTQLPAAVHIPAHGSFLEHCPTSRGMGGRSPALGQAMDPSTRSSPKVPLKVLSSRSRPSRCSHTTTQDTGCPVAHQRFPSCLSFLDIPVTQCPGSFCAGGKNCCHRAGLCYVSLSSQSPEDDLIA